MRLLRAIFEDRECEAAKLCLNTDKTRPWKGTLVMSRFMIMNEEKYRIDTTAKPNSTGEAEGRFELHYYRVCGEYLDKTVTRCNNETICTDLLLLMEQAAREDPFVTAYVLVVLDFQDQDHVTHTSFVEIDLFFSQFPNVLVGGMPVGRIKKHHRRLFPDVSPLE